MNVNLLITNPMESGINQLMRYMNRRNPSDNEGCEKLFYNQMIVSTHFDHARVATISANIEHYLEWKDPYPFSISDLGEEPSNPGTFIQGMFSKENFRSY